MSNINFVELATYCQNKYRESVPDNDYLKHVKTLYFAITEENNISCSTTPHILDGASKCFLMHITEQRAVTNWYYWYKSEFIDSDGCVHDGHFGDGFRFVSTYRDSYIKQVLLLEYENTTIYCCEAPFESNFSKFWQLYLRLKNIKNVDEMKLIAELFEKDEKILRLESENENSKFINHLLEKERDQYKEILDEIKAIVKSMRP